MLLALYATTVALISAVPDLAPQRLYYQINAPIPITIIDRPADAACILALLAPDNTEIARADLLPSSASQIDLAQYFPDLEKLKKTHYLQLIIDAQPVGSSLVVEPVQRRPSPVVRNGPNGPVVVKWEDLPDDQRFLTGYRIYPERFIQLNTTLGDITIALRPDEAPNTAWNFRFLVDGGFYTHIPFHRVIGTTRSGAGFVIQAGDPTGTGNGGPGYLIDLEPSKLPHDLGVISMAREGRDINTAGSQFFLCLSRQATERLDVQYTSFGQTVAGLDVVQKIGNLETDPGDRPMKTPYITTAQLIPASPRTPGSEPTWMQPKPDPTIAKPESNPQR